MAGNQRKQGGAGGFKYPRHLAWPATCTVLCCSQGLLYYDIYRGDGGETDVSLSTSESQESSLRQTSPETQPKLSPGKLTLPPCKPSRSFEVVSSSSSRWPPPDWHLGQVTGRRAAAAEAEAEAEAEADEDEDEDEDGDGSEDKNPGSPGVPTPLTCSAIHTSAIQSRAASPVQDGYEERVATRTHPTGIHLDGALHPGTPLVHGLTAEARGLNRGTWDVGRGTWDVGRGTWDVGRGTRNADQDDRSRSGVLREFESE
ncbi:hypothetical protein JHW43_004317 [Diplocarpon mali]|nr:hypothetical protein JHW43_004317 [Diplocarpon mali]